MTFVKRIGRTLPVATSLVGLAPTIVGAQGLTAVRPLPNYECALLNLDPERMRDPSVMVPVYNGPSTASGVLGEAGAIVFVKTPRHLVNGFAEMLFPDGRTAWIDARWLAPMPTRHSRKCTPSIMSNGKLGIG